MKAMYFHSPNATNECNIQPYFTFTRVIIAERSEANNRDPWASKSQLAVHVASHASLVPGGKARVQNGASVYSN